MTKFGIFAVSGTISYSLYNHKLDFDNPLG